MPASRKRKDADSSAKKSETKRARAGATSAKKKAAVAASTPEPPSAALRARSSSKHLTTDQVTTPKSRSGSGSGGSSSKGSNISRSNSGKSPASSTPKETPRRPAVLKRSSSITEDLNGFIDNAHSFIGEKQPKRKDQISLLTVATAGLIDLVFFFGMSAAGLAVALVFKWCDGEYGWCEHDFFKMWLKTLRYDEDETVSTFFKYLLGDLSESIVLAAALLAFSTFAAAWLLLATRGQTPGTFLTALCVSMPSSSAKSSRARPLTTLIWAAISCTATPVETVRYLLQGADARPFADIVLKTKVAAAAAVKYTVTTAYYALPPVAGKASKNPVADKVRAPRQWCDLLGVVVFFVCQFVIILKANEFIAKSGRTSSGWGTFSGWGIYSIWFDFWTNVGKTITNEPKTVGLCLLGTWAYAVVFFLLIKAFLKPLFYVGVAAICCGELAFLLRTLDDGDAFQVCGALTVLASSILYLGWNWNMWMHMLTSWTLAISATVSHPLSILHVPLLECGFQMYQCWLCTKIAGVHDAQSSQERSTVLNQLKFLQFFTVFTLRAVFEVATAGAVARWYFSQPGESSITRSVSSILAAHTKNFGSCCWGGLFQFIVNAVNGVYLRLKSSYDRMSWSTLPTLPVKLALFFTCWIVGMFARWLEVFAGYTMTYVGIYGTSYGASATKSFDLMRTNGALAVTAACSSDSVFYMLVTSASTILYPILNIVENAAEGTVHKWHGVSLIPFICIYCFVSMCWMLKNAMNAVIVCSVEEMNNVPKADWKAPPHLAAVMAKYRK